MRTCGIYLIEHQASGRVYVGSSIWIEDRWRQHRRYLKAGTHHSQLLLRAWRKYGADAFKWSVVEQCATEDLHERETFWIEHYRACDRDHGFNRSPVGGTNRGLKFGPEICAKIRAAKANISDETRRRLREAHKTRPPPSPETKAKMSRSNSGPRAPRSEETKAKLRAALTGRKADPADVEKRAAAIRGRKQSPESVAARAKKLTGLRRSDEAREKMRQSALRRHTRERAEAEAARAPA